jgi:patatin-like phospholipase/acyl hydrolase
MAAQFRILSIDGGGIRGIIPALVLAEIERRTGKRIYELFNLIAGTSTGGIIALGLTKPKPDGSGTPQYAAKDLVKLYENEGGRIFSTSLLHRIFSLGNVLDKKYESGPIEEVLAEFFGEAKLSEALTRVLIPSYEIELRKAFFFKSHKAAGDMLVRGEDAEEFDFLMRDVARATSAAPTYFEPELIDRTRVNEELSERKSIDEEDGQKDAYALIDGGVYANNPAMCALAEAICESRFNRKLGDVFMVSLGTGEQKRPLAFQSVKNWGLLSWAQPILSVVFHGVSDTVNYQTRLILNSGRARRHYRLQIELDKNQPYQLDDTRPEAINMLKGLAQKLIKQHDENGDLDKICRELVPQPKRRAAATKRRAAAGKGRAAPAKSYAATSKARAAARTRTSAKKSAR